MERRIVPYSILIEFGTSMKILNSFRMCLSGTTRSVCCITFVCHVSYL